MNPTQSIAAAELAKRIDGVRTLSGCFRLVRTIEQNEIDTSQSREKIALLTQLLEKMKELSPVDPEEIPRYIDSEQRTLMRNYAIVLLERAGHHNISADGLKEGESDGRQALRLARALRDETMEALALNHVGNTLMITQNTQEAREYFQASAELDRKNGHFESLARSLYNLARAELSLGAFHNALEAVNEGLQLHEQHSSLPALGNAFFLSVRQDIYESQDESGKALADALRSLQLFQQLKMIDRLTLAHYHLVYRYLSIDDTTEAMHHAMQAAAAAAQTGSPIDTIFSSLALSTLYIRLEEFDTAMQYLRDGVQLARAIGVQRMEVMCLERIARILRQRGEHQLALHYLYEALAKEARPKGKTDLHKIIASVWLELGQMEDARRELLKRLEASQGMHNTRTDVDFLLISADIAGKEKKFEEAISTLNAILAMQNIRPTFRKDAHLALSDLYTQTGDLHKALDHYREYHAVAIELEQRLAGHRLTVLRAQHEVESHRTEAVKAQELQQRIEQEKELLALEVSERQRVIEHTRHELNNALRTLQQNDLSEGKAIVQGVLQILQRTPAATEEQWLHHLPNLDSDFFARLREHYPTLTKGQVRLSGLLRSGMSSAEIAQRLHVSLETVTTQRKRLRKRMNLKEGENLEHRLAQI